VLRPLIGDVVNYINFFHTALHRGAAIWPRWAAAWTAYEERPRAREWAFLQPWDHPVAQSHRGAQAATPGLGGTIAGVYLFGKVAHSAQYHICLVDTATGKLACPIQARDDPDTMAVVCLAA